MFTPGRARPFRVLDAGRFAAACRAAIAGPAVARLPAPGAIDQFGDSTDLLSDVSAARPIAIAAIAPRT